MNTKLMIYPYWIKHHVLGQVPLAETPVDVVSCPKSGRTWMRMMLGYVLCENYKLDKSDMLDTSKLTKEASLPSMNFTHAGTDFNEKTLPLSTSQLTEKLLIPYAKSRVILLIRDPRDILVSSYFHATKRDLIYTGDISTFIRTDTFGIEKILKFYDIWYRYRWYPKQLLVIRYEDIHGDPENVLKRVLRFSGLDFTDKLVESAIEYARFDNMQRLEKQKAFKDKRLTASDVNDLDSYKVRRGVVGGYADYLSDEDIQFLADRISRESTAFIQCYT
jgi:hypothetical protein